MAEALERVRDLRGRLLGRARELGLEAADEEAAIEAVLDREVAVPRAGEAECRRYYEAHPAEFRQGAAAWASHILFAVSAGTPVEALRRKAEEVLAQVKADPERFPRLARELSNCPSGAEGGRLGAIRRGETVPEFERAVLEATTPGVLPRLVCTRLGFHVVRVERVEAGRAVPFEAVREALARHLEALARHRALRQYAQVLEGGAPLVR